MGDEPVADLDFSLAGKVAVVTGGASGIGRAIVEAYAGKGATVVVVDRAVAAAEPLVQSGVAAAVLGCDVTQPASVADVVSAVADRFARIDVLVNSAGLAILGAAEELSLERWHTTLAVNLTGAYTMTQQVGRIMLAHGRGTVISLASQAASVALPGHVAYC